ncbi:hypothetical protein HanHA300_Chr08g0274121 [Helianthus annuus]|nr:hypothetical protein HanHA300_Chr08g0274121 [Helianthus annuus]
MFELCSFNVRFFILMDAYAKTTKSGEISYMDAYGFDVELMMFFIFYIFLMSYG